MKNLGFLAILAACLFFGAHPSISSQGHDAASVIITLNSHEKNEKPEPSFRCSGRVYAHLTFPSSLAGQQKIEGIWIKPNGEDQERSVLKVNVDGENRKAYFWMEFKEKTMFDDIKLGAYGQGNEFNGLWTFIGLANGQQIVQMPFQVECL